MTNKKITLKLYLILIQTSVQCVQLDIFYDQLTLNLL